MTHSPEVAGIAAGSRHTSRAGLHALEKGGNAWDAAIAALAMAFVAEPLLASPGGGGYLLSDPVNGDAEVLDFFAQTPGLSPAENGIKTETLDFRPIHGDFGGTKQEFHIGAAAAAVPGAIAGLLAMHRQYASLPLPELLADAIDAARAGIELEASQRYVADILTPILQSSSLTSQTFLPDENGRYRNPALADFLQTLAELGCEKAHHWFYRGEVAEAIAAAQDTAGLIRLQDLADYAVIPRQPLRRDFPGYTVLTNPPPSTGGQLIVAELAHAHSNDAPLPQRLAEAMREADRLKGTASRRGTTHISVFDCHGNLASLTVSNGEGNGQVIAPFGFMLNNFLGEEDINPGGFFRWPVATRLASMMAPTVLHSDSGHRFALGSGGSNRIKTAIFQVIWHAMMGAGNTPGQGKPLNFAISHPRLHYENGVLDIEAGWPEEAIAQLTAAFPQHRLWDRPNLYFGGVHAVQTGTTNTAIGDFRRQGCGIARDVLPQSAETP